jgi:hypothetical protein
MGQWLTGELKPEDARIVIREPARKGSRGNNSRS